MSRKPGFIAPSRAARLLDVHPNTVYAYCRAAVAGEPSKLKHVERNPVTGYYRISLDEVKALASQDDEDSSGK